MQVSTSVNELACGRSTNSLPQVDAEGIPNALRTDLYGGLAVNPLMTPANIRALEGSEYIVTNPTVSTGVAHATLTALSLTAGLFSIKNNGTKTAFLNYLKLWQTATAPTTSVCSDFLFKRDASTRGIPTANLLLQTPVNLKNGGPASGLLCYSFAAGSLTIPAEVSAQITGRTRITHGVSVIQDEFVIQCGANDVPGASGQITAARATNPARFVAHVPPQIILPGEWLTIYRWGLAEATNVASYEYELSFTER